MSNSETELMERLRRLCGSDLMAGVSDWVSDIANDAIAHITAKDDEIARLKKENAHRTDQLIAETQAKNDNAHELTTRYSKVLFEKGATIASRDARIAGLREARDFYHRAHAEPDDGIGTRNDALDWILSAVDAAIADASPEERA